jgi:hypothetical protein
MASPAPLTVVPSTGSSQIGDKEVEELLSEKLLEGYAILDTACPDCVTPLVKRKSSALSPKRYVQTLSPRKSDSPYISIPYVPVQLQPSSPNAGSFDAAQSTFTPVPNVPICVSCQAHVVTCQAELSILESTNSMKDIGKIIIAMEEEEGREAPDVASPSRLAEKSFFASDQTERQSPEDYVEDNTSDKENGMMEKVRAYIEEDEPEYEPEDPPFQEEEETEEGEEQMLEDLLPVDEQMVEDSLPVDDYVESHVLAREDNSPSVEDNENSNTGEVLDEVKETIDRYDYANELLVNEENSITAEVSDEEKETIHNYDANGLLAKQTSPSMASFFCASTASYQYVVPSPISSPKASFTEEEGIEHDLDEHKQCMERAGSEAALSAILPPKPLVSDLLQADEEEELDQARQAMSPRVKPSLDTKQDGALDAVEGDTTFEADEVLQEYSVR